MNTHIIDLHLKGYWYADCVRYWTLSHLNNQRSCIHFIGVVPQVSLHVCAFWSYCYPPKIWWSCLNICFSILPMSRPCASKRCTAAILGTPRSAMLNRGSYPSLTCARRSKMSRQIAIKVVAIDPPRGRPHMIQMFRVLLSSICKHPMSECLLDGGWMDGWWALWFGRMGDGLGWR